jgi:hypothetical protein
MIIVVQVGAVKIYVVAMEAFKKKKKDKVELNFQKN